LSPDKLKAWGEWLQTSLFDAVTDDVASTAIPGVADSPEKRKFSPELRISRRARRLSIRVFPDARVEVVVPPRARPREVERFISSQREWIEAKRIQALANRPAPEVFPPEFIDFPLTGERWRVHVGRGSGAPRITERGGPADADRRLLIGGEVKPVALRRALRAWSMRAARERLESRVSSIAARLGVRYARVSIRRQRSRWGSCSVRGTISLNVCLLFQRAPVVDYLIVHELTHVKHMNHSPRFWKAVEAACADWRDLDRELLRGWRTVPRWMFSDH
jgi:predicted metal-dependent hydrolase